MHGYDSLGVRRETGLVGSDGSQPPNAVYIFTNELNCGSSLRLGESVGK